MLFRSTSYAKNQFGKDCTVLLSEQSFNSSRGQEVQAAAYAYAYYISEGNSQIEAFIYGREFDHPEEMKSGYHWGLCDNWHSKRLIWSVFQYIDSKDSFTFTDPLLKHTNLKKWTKISGHKKTKFTKMASKRKKGTVQSVTPASSTSLTVAWEKMNTGDGYEVYRNGSKIATITGNSEVTYTDKKLTTGSAHMYQVRMFKDAPDRRIYGDLSEGVWGTVTAPQAALNEKNCEVSGNVIKVAWTKLSDVSGFEVFRSTEVNGNYTLLASVAGDKTSYKDSATVSGTTYFYKVRAFTAEGGVNYYGAFSGVTEQLARIQVTAGIINGKVVINWTKWLNAERYRVYCKPKAAASYVRMKTLNALTYECSQYTDAAGQKVDFVVGEIYSFRVRADFGDGTYSKYSNEVDLVIDGQMQPAVISDVDAEAETESDGMPENEPETESGELPEPESESEDEPESEPETEPGEVPENEPETESGEKPDEVPENEPETESEEKPDEVPENEPETEPKEMPEEKPGTESEGVPGEEPGTEPEKKPEQAQREQGIAADWKAFRNLYPQKI